MTFISAIDAATSLDGTISLILWKHSIPQGITTAQLLGFDWYHHLSVMYLLHIFINSLLSPLSKSIPALVRETLDQNGVDDRIDTII